MSESWDQGNVESISNSVIKLAVITNKHPFKVLDRMMKLATCFKLEDINGMTIACRKFITSKRSELPFYFDEPRICEKCLMVYHHLSSACPHCGNHNE